MPITKGYTIKAGLILFFLFVSIGCFLGEQERDTGAIGKVIGIASDPVAAIRDLPDTANPGDSIQVTLTMDVTEGQEPTSIGLSEFVPSGWTVTAESPDGDYSAENNKVNWLFSALFGLPVQDTTITYTIRIPQDADGSYTFSGTIDYGGASNPSVGGDTTISVSGPVVTSTTSTSTTSTSTTAVETTTTVWPYEHSVYVSRDLPSSANPNEAVSVTLTMDINEAAGLDSAGLVEELPDGWEFVSMSPTGDYNSESDRISWIFWAFGLALEDQTITYSIRAPSDANGQYTFNGTIDYGGDTDPSVSGDYVLFVIGTPLTTTTSTSTTSTTSTSTISASEYPVMVNRTLVSSGTPGSNITVTMTMEVDESDIPDSAGVIEYLPEGWNILGMSVTGEQKTNPNRIEWLFWSFGTAVEDQDFTYMLQVPANASGTYTFSGTVDYGGAVDPAIGGDSGIWISDIAVTTTTIPATHPLNVTRVLSENVTSGSELTVTLMMDVDESNLPDSIGVTETPPSGWNVTATEPTGLVENGSIEWLFWELGSPVQDTNITYSVTVPSDANGTYAFNGTSYYGLTSVYPVVIGDTEILAIFGCELTGDEPPCGEVALAEVVAHITLWSLGEATLADVVALITAWSG